MNRFALLGAVALLFACDAPTAPVAPTAPPSAQRVVAQQASAVGDISPTSGFTTGGNSVTLEGGFPTSITVLVGIDCDFFSGCTPIYATVHMTYSVTFNGAGAAVIGNSGSTLTVIAPPSASPGPAAIHVTFCFVGGTCSAPSLWPTS
jgi:hypothetical protein